MGQTISNRRDTWKNERKVDDDGNKEAIYYVDYVQNELTESEVQADMGALFGLYMFH